MMSDQDLRELLAAEDPAADLAAPDVLASLQLDPPPRRRRRLLPVGLAAAVVAILGLLTVAVVPRFSSPQVNNIATDDATTSLADGPVSTQTSDPGAAQDPVFLGGPSIARTASLLVTADDPNAAADDFVRRISAMQGRIVSQTVVTKGSEAPMTSGSMMADSDAIMTYYSGPGVWLTVQVPYAEYDNAVAAAREAGVTVRMEQTSDDLSAEVADTDARVRALRSSVRQLRALMSEANDVSEVITLEEAISERQSELDGLLAQQRELASVTRMSQISLTLMTPDAAEENSSNRAGWIIAGTLVLVALAAVIVFLVRRRRP